MSTVLPNLITLLTPVNTSQKKSSINSASTSWKLFSQLSVSEINGFMLDYQFIFSVMVTLLRITPTEALEQFSPNGCRNREFGEVEIGYRKNILLQYKIYNLNTIVINLF
jgi:hypothetical protein